PYIMILYATPMVALIPFILSMMGFGFAPKLLVVFLFAVFPVLYNTVEGARSIKPELIEVAKSFRSSEWALWREVMLPYTLPYTMTGVRQAIGRALVGMIAAEFFLSATGLGQLIMSASQNFDTGGVFASILVIGLLGVALTRLGLVIEQHFARWRQYRGRTSSPPSLRSRSEDAEGVERIIRRLAAATDHGICHSAHLGNRRARLRSGLRGEADHRNTRHSESADRAGVSAGTRFDSCGGGGRAGAQGRPMYRT